MHSSSVVILPTHVDGQDGHCFCDNWLLIKDCSCLGDIADYNVYNPEKSLPVELCFSNVTNNTMIQMVYQTYNIFTNTPTEFFPLYNELFMESYHFITIGKTVKIKSSFHRTKFEQYNVLTNSLTFNADYK